MRAPVLLQVLSLKDTLELKLRMLSVPLEVCVQQAIKGNSALQDVLDVALAILRDIETFETTLHQQELAAVGDLACMNL